jgi:xanthine/uracil permease
LSYTLTTVAVAWADSINPRLVFPVGMGMYIAKFSLLGVMMIAVAGTDWPGRIPMAVGIVLGVVAWTGTQIWWTVRTSRPIVPDRAP